MEPGISSASALISVRRTLACDCSGRPDLRSRSTTTPSGLLGRYTPTDSLIFIISSSILAFFSGFDFLMYGLSLPEMLVTASKKLNSRS